MQLVSNSLINAELPSTAMMYHPYPILDSSIPSRHLQDSSLKVG